jgi:uncharacterized membrane protein YfcA
VHDLTVQKGAVLALAVLFLGLSKGGFAGGLGMLTTPLCALAFDAKDAIGIVLPLLCAGDVFSLYFYWRKWEPTNLRFLLPGVVAGVIVGVQLIGRFTNRDLNIAIGAIAVLFVGFQLVKETIYRAEGVFAPNHAAGVPCGVTAGITSTIAHGAAPVISMFLIPQRLPKETYVGTTTLVFTCINGIKVPFFIGNHIITPQTLATSLALLPLIPFGVWLGVWLNRKVSELWFARLIYLFTFLTGLQLIFNFSPAHWWR